MNAVALRSARAQAEAQRQQALLQALFAVQVDAQPAPQLDVRQRGVRWRAGLQAYRGNGFGHARLALRSQFPTVLAMLGEDAFDALVARYRRDFPPRSGDLAAVGSRFPRVLAAHPDLIAWPWLAASARLDWARWQLRCAAPARLQQADLERLTQADAQQLRLRLAAGTRLLHSRWPIHTLWQLHQAPHPDALALRAALHAAGEWVWLWRADTQIASRVLDAAEATWLRALRRGSLAQALRQVPAQFDVAGWLQQAVAQGWLDRVVLLAGAHRGPSPHSNRSPT